MNTFVCRVCANYQGNLYHSTLEMMLGFRDVYNYVECGSCGCLQIEKYPDSIQKYYPDNYYSYRRPQFRGRNFKQKMIDLRDRHDLGFSNFLGRLLSVFRPNNEFINLSRYGLKPDSKILDVGCGYGGFLIKLRDLGFSNLFGIDPFCEPDNHIDGVQIFKMDMSEVNGIFDFIMLNHSFEHMPKPRQQFDHLLRLLSHDGVCMVRVPVASSYAWKYYKTNWVQLDAPRHFYLHTPKSIKILADQAGLELFDVRYDSTYFQFTGSEMYSRNISLKEAESQSANIFSRRDIKRYQRKADKLNANGLGDQAVFYLRKSHAARSVAA